MELNKMAKEWERENERSNSKKKKQQEEELKYLLKEESVLYVYIYAVASCCNTSGERDGIKQSWLDWSQARKWEFERVNKRERESI